MPSFFGVQVANGFASEARVFATLLAHRGSSFEARVLCHAWPADTRSFVHFRGASMADVVPLDVGWRPNEDGSRSHIARAGSIARRTLALRPILRLARAYQPDLIYSSQQHWDCFVATYLARKLRKPQIIHLHYRVCPWLRRQPLSRLKRCEHVVATSRFIRDEVVRHGAHPHSVSVVYNPVEPQPPITPEARNSARRRLGLPLNRPVVGCVGRLSEDRSPVDVLEGFSGMRCPEALLVMIGDGPLRGHLEKRAEELGCRDRVVMAGYQPDAAEVLPALDVFAQACRAEAFGMALAEASACGLPVVACRTGAGNELVADGETGLLADAGDARQLAACMRALLEDPAGAREMGAAGRERMLACFSPQAAGAAFASVVLEAAGC